MNHAETIEDFAHEMGFDIIFHDDGSPAISRDYYTKSFLDVDDLRRLLARRGSQ
jgi:hypothetical protein